MSSRLPYVLPFLAEGKFSGVTLQGVEDLQQHAVDKFGPGNYRPNLFVTYWSFRAMIGLLLVPVLFALTTLWLTHRGRTRSALVRPVRVVDAADTLPGVLGGLGVHRNGPPALGGGPNPTSDPMVPDGARTGCRTTTSGWSGSVSRWSMRCSRSSGSTCCAATSVRVRFEHDAEPAPRHRR